MKNNRRDNLESALVEHLEHRRLDPEYDRLVQRVFDLSDAHYSIKEIADMVELSTKGVSRILKWKGRY